jgi:hypothetical protein
MDETRPLPYDPSYHQVQSFLDAASDDAEWLLTAPGEYQTAAVETTLYDGSKHQKSVLMEIPVRTNHTSDYKTIRLFMSAEDAVSIAKCLIETAMWMEMAERTGN